MNAAIDDFVRYDLQNFPMLHLGDGVVGLMNFGAAWGYISILIPSVGNEPTSRDYYMMYWPWDRHAPYETGTSVG